MGLFDFDSDYSSGSSSTSTSPWGSWKWPAPPTPPLVVQQKTTDLIRSSSAGEVENKRGLDDIMREFKMNGSDSPYDPDEDRSYGRFSGLTGMGPPSSYLRQKSWPEPEVTPAQPLPNQVNKNTLEDWKSFTEALTEALNDTENSESLLARQFEKLRRQQRVLSVAEMWVQAQGRRRQAEPPTQSECKFCRNNGERATFWRSHALRDARGVVKCPVLRAYVCPRCGARGDTAHTAKYCPWASHDERSHASAMMRSMRLASGRRRSLVTDNTSHVVTSSTDTLDPVWAALEHKLSLV